MREIARERFVLEVFHDGGILLDLESGMLLQLNHTSTFIWKRALSGHPPDQIAAAFARAFDLTESLARRDVSTTLVLPPAPDSPSAASEFSYQLVDARYRFSLRGTATLEISASGDAIRRLDGVGDADLMMSLSAISPKLVALRGASVLHAAAVMRADGRVMAFLGESGAGKTTTARAFARAGLRLVCEDKLVLRLQPSGVAVDLQAEGRISAWLRRTRAQLQSLPSGTWCNPGIPDEVADESGSARGAVTDILLVDRTRRRGTAIDLEPVGPAAATGEIFKNAFFGSAAPEEWRRNVSATATIARTARTFRAILPAGLQALEAAARTYTEMTAS